MEACDISLVKTSGDDVKMSPSVFIACKMKTSARFSLLERRLYFSENFMSMFLGMNSCQTIQVV